MSVLRHLARDIAKANMKRKGMVKICKHDHTQGYAISGKRGEITYVNSYFAKHWRENV